MVTESSQILFLASASPRRRQLLGQLGFEVQVQAVDMDESRHEGESPEAYCVRLALDKNQLAVSRYQPTLPVVTADTIVVMDNDTLGKPENRQAVIETLNRLSDNTHQVITAVAIHHRGEVVHDRNISRVQFGAIDPNWITVYADSKEPYDKAGAYGIQGSAGRWIKSINGSYSGIMGLPLYETAQLLSQLGLMSDARHNNRQTT